MKRKKHFQLRKKIHVVEMKELIPIPVTLGELVFLKNVTPDKNDKSLSPIQARKIIHCSESIQKKAQEAFLSCDRENIRSMEEIVAWLHLSDEECGTVSGMLLSIQTNAHTLPVVERKTLLHTVNVLYQKMEIIIATELLFR